MFLKETWTWTGHPARIHSLSTNYSQGKGSWRKRASVGTTRFVEGPGGMVLRRKALLFSEKRKRYLTDKIIGFLYRCSSYLPIHLPSFFFFFSFWFCLVYFALFTFPVFMSSFWAQIRSFFFVSLPFSVPTMLCI